jgi:hypothetical protein
VEGIVLSTNGSLFICSLYDDAGVDKCHFNKTVLVF